MNEIERLIARLPRPSPSEDLDQRIAGLEEWPPLEIPASLTDPAVRVRARGPIGLLVRRIAAFAGTAACAGIAGFALGRQSVVPAPEVEGRATSPMVAAAVPATPAPGPAALPVVVVWEESEALARFVMPTRFGSMFGNGPLVEKSESPPPLE